MIFSQARVCYPLVILDKPLHVKLLIDMHGS